MKRLPPERFNIIEWLYDVANEKDVFWQNLEPIISLFLTLHLEMNTLYRQLQVSLEMNEFSKGVLIFRV